jgi:LysR family transcriptional activator of glutamate synthase operon
MDILKLRYFLVVARCQNMTKAAEALHVAQPAISQAIKKLDDELGVKLFDRVGKNIRLSETGKLFYTKVEPLVKALDDIPQILATEVGMENKTVKINILSAHELITTIVSNYKKEYGETSFQLSQDEEDDNWDIRISSVYDRMNTDAEDTVLSEEILIAVPRESHFSEGDSIRLEDIKHVGFVSLERNRQFAVQTAGFCMSAGFEPLIVFEGESPEMIARLVGAGIGVAFWPKYSWGKLNDERVKLMHIADMDCSWNIYLTRKNSIANSPMKESFQNYVVDYLNKIEKE